MKNIFIYCIITKLFLSKQFSNYPVKNPPKNPPILMVYPLRGGDFTARGRLISLPLFQVISHPVLTPLTRGGVPRSASFVYSCLAGKK